MQRVGVLVELPRLLRDVGVDPEPVIRSAGLHPGQLADTDGFIPFDLFSELLVQSIAAAGREDFDLLVGASGRCEHLGVLGRYMACAATFGSALDDLLSNHPRYVRGAGAYLLDLGDGDLLVGYRTHRPGIRGASPIARGATAFGYSVFREVSGVLPKAILMSLPAPASLAGYQAVFGSTPVQFNAQHFGLVFSRSSLRTPNLKADPELRRMLGDAIAARWAAHQPDVRERVMRALVPSVFSGTHSLESTARRIAMTPEALSRELKELGCSFRDLYAEAKLEMAGQFLTDARMSIAQVAHILGYSEISAFTRFFTAGRGVAPAQWRRSRSHGEAAALPPLPGLPVEPVQLPGA